MKTYFTEMVCKLYKETYPNSAPNTKFFVSKSGSEMMMMMEKPNFPEILLIVMNVGGSDNPITKEFWIGEFFIEEDKIEISKETMEDRLMDFYNKFYK